MLLRLRLRRRMRVRQDVSRGAAEPELLRRWRVTCGATRHVAPVSWMRGRKHGERLCESTYWIAAVREWVGRNKLVPVRYNNRHNQSQHHQSDTHGRAHTQTRGKPLCWGCVGAPVVSGPAFAPYEKSLDVVLSRSSKATLSTPASPAARLGPPTPVDRSRPRRIGPACKHEQSVRRNLDITSNCRLLVY